MEHTSGKMYISQQGGVMEEIVSKSLLQDNLKMKYFHAININEGIVPVSYTHLDVYKRQVL